MERLSLDGKTMANRPEFDEHIHDVVPGAI